MGQGGNKRRRCAWSNSGKASIALDSQFAIDRLRRSYLNGWSIITNKSCAVLFSLLGFPRLLERDERSNREDAIQ